MSTLDWGIFLVAVIILAVSGLTILYNLVKGEHKTRLTDKYVWGLNIQVFYALSSFGTGLMAVMAASILLLEGGISLEILQISSSIALACMLAGIILMGIDLGRPSRIIKILQGKKFNSPLTLDFLALGLLVILSILLTAGVGATNPFAMKIWAYLALLASMLCMATHTLLVAPRFEAGFRSNPFFAAETLVCSIWSGIAILVLLTAGDPLQKSLISMMLVLSGASLIMGVSSAISISLGKGKLHTHKKVFILLTILSFLVLVISDLFSAGQGALVVAASLLTLAAVITEKSSSVLAVQKRPVVPAPYSSLESEPHYVPSFTEIGHLCFSIAMIFVIPYGVFILRIIA